MGPDLLAFVLMMVIIFLMAMMHGVMAGMVVQQTYQMQMAKLYIHGL